MCAISIDPVGWYNSKYLEACLGKYLLKRKAGGEHKERNPRGKGIDLLLGIILEKITY